MTHKELDAALAQVEERLESLHEWAPSDARPFISYAVQDVLRARECIGEMEA